MTPFCAARINSGSAALERGERRGTIAAGDRLLDIAQMRAHARAARLVDCRAARDLAGRLLGGRRIGHRCSVTGGGRRQSAEEQCRASAKKQRRRTSPPPCVRPYSQAVSGRQRAGSVARANGGQATRSPAPDRSRPPPARRSRSGNAARGGITRRQARSSWMWASSALTPDTSALPSNSLRIVTAASCAAASPCAKARAHRSAVEIGGRRDAAGEGAGAGVEQHRLGRREHVEARARSPRPRARRPCRRRNPSGRRCGRRSVSSSRLTSVDDARAGRTADGK